MASSHFKQIAKGNRTQNYTRLLFLTMFAVAAVIIAASTQRFFSSRAALAGTISGTVFQDYNSNGNRDAGATLANAGSGSMNLPADRGVAGVTVTAYNSAGAASGSATTDASGAYSLFASGTGPYRIEFTNLPAGFQPGVNSTGKTAVQFVPDGNSSGVDLAINIPAEYCQDNPTIVTSCYVGGPNDTGAEVLVSFPMSAGSTRTSGSTPFSDFDAPAHGILARANQIGTTWGLGYARQTRQLYAAAFMKKHAGYGPGGTGAIYRIDPATGTPSVYANLNALLGANNAGANTHNTADYDRDNGNTSWDAVGKTALGGVAISGDETKLYTINLATRQLVEIPLNAAPSAANIRVKGVPTNPPGSANAGDVRPFAVAWYLDRLYVGMVNTAESTGNASQLFAYVYSVDPVTLDFSAAPVFQAALNYPRRCTDSAQLGAGNCFSAAWRPWSVTYANIGTEGRGIYPQPWLTGITFDNGNLVLGIRDRAGDQFGNNTQDNPADSLLYYGVSAGDILRASGNPASGWTLESNGRAGGQGTAPQGTNEGPGGGEFYFGDVAVPFGDENTQGGVLQVGGYTDVMTTVYDPIPLNNTATLFDGGVQWYNNTTGVRNKSYRVYDGALTAAIGPFGKANGLGDLEALCDAAPIELGNRIWRDANANGIQDAGEAGIAGLTVQLFKGGALVGTTTTAGDGSYFFNASNVSGGILPQMAYEIRVLKTQSGLSGFNLSPNDNDSSANGDSRDSDAVMNGDNAVIALTTGLAGANNHTYDIGFAAPQVQNADLTVTKDDGRATYLPGDLLVYAIRVTNLGPIDVVNARVTDVLPATLQSASWTCVITAPGTGAVVSACGQPSGTNDINTTVTLRVGGVATYTLRARVAAATTGLVVNTVTVTPPAGITDPTPGNNRATDTDSNQNGPTGGSIGPGMVTNPGNSILVFPVYTSNAANTTTENTRISLTNTSPSQTACVHLFFVDGSSCSVADAYICLTPNQTTTFLSSDLDPGTMGYLVAVAVDCATGCPINFNNLIGDEYVKFANGFSGNLKAECIPAVASVPVVCGTDLAVLNLDGTSYARVPQTLALSNIQSPADGNRTMIVLDRIGGNLANGVGSLGTVFGLLYDDAESAYSFSLSGAACQLKAQLSDSLPRTAPRFSSVIPAGRTGWMKLSAPTGIGMIGAQFTSNSNVASSPGAFNGGHALHQLTQAASASLTIPVFPPSC